MHISPEKTFKNVCNGDMCNAISEGLNRMRKIIITILAAWLLLCFFILAVMIPFVGYVALFWVLTFLISIISFLSFYSMKRYIISNILLYAIVFVNLLFLTYYSHEEVSFLIIWTPCFLLLMPLISTSKARHKNEAYDNLLFATSLTPGIIITLFNVIKSTCI